MAAGIWELVLYTALVYCWVIVLCLAAPFASSGLAAALTIVAGIVSNIIWCFLIGEIRLEYWDTDIWIIGITSLLLATGAVVIGAIVRFIPLLLGTRDEY